MGCGASSEQPAASPPVAKTEETAAPAPAESAPVEVAPASEEAPAASEETPAAEEAAEEAAPAAEEVAAPAAEEVAAPAAEEEAAPAAEEETPALEVEGDAASESPADDAPSAEAMDVEGIFKQIEEIRAAQPGNRCVKYCTREVFDAIPEDQRDTFMRCVQTGIDNPDSGLGCYAQTPADYTTFASFFDKVIGDYHKDDPNTDAKHETDWDLSSVGDNGVLDVTKLGLDELSMRVRVGRNLAEFNLPGMMDRAERIKFEQKMLGAFEALKTWAGGEIYSLTPDFGEGVENPNLISEEKYQELIKQHVMFKDMDADPYLKSAGISSDWPYGRGCWQSEDKQCIVWFGEEDQLRIMCMKTGARLDEVFTRLRELLDTVEAIDGLKFATNDRYGYVTSCPSNLGTGMRASVHIKCPNLTSDGTDKKAKEICDPLGLSVRGTGGEHTPIGADGTIDVSPRNRLFIKESEIVAKLYKGIQDLMAQEKAAGEGGVADVTSKLEEAAVAE